MTRLPVINCRHWAKGACLRGHHGGSPSTGLCLKRRHEDCAGAAKTGAFVEIPDPPGAAEAMRLAGPGLWAELHRKPYLHLRSASIDELWAYARWFDDFAARLPCGECRNHWLRWVREHPLSPDATADDVFAWGFDAHNAVNARLGKPTMTLDEARARWPRPNS